MWLMGETFRMKRRERGKTNSVGKFFKCLSFPNIFLTFLLHLCVFVRLLEVVGFCIPGRTSHQLTILVCRCFAAGLCLRRFPEQGWNYCKSSPPLSRLWHWAAAFSAAHVLSTVREEVQVTNTTLPIFAIHKGLLA